MIGYLVMLYLKDIALARTRLLLFATMQSQDDPEPTVRIRDLKKDRADFVLENVDLACAAFLCAYSRV